MAPKRKLTPKTTRKLRKKAREATESKQILDLALAEVGYPSTPGPKIVKRYPKEKCAEEGCRNYAVGSGDVCRAHGGDPLIRDNLLQEHEVTTMIANGSLFDPRVHPIAYIECSREGMSEVEIAAEFGVSVHTIRTWSETYLEFNTGYEIGNAMYEAWWLQEGRDNLDNRSYNVGLYKFLTMNKLGYSDKVESKSLHVHAGVLQVPAQMNADDWVQSVKNAEGVGDDTKKET